MYVLLIALFSLSLGYAQSLSQVVVSTSGATLSGASNTLSFTAGEPIVGLITNGPSLGQGFWAGGIIVLGSEDFTFDVEATVYPNPVSDYLNLYFNEMAGQDFEISIYDLNGRQILHREFKNSASNEMLDFSSYSAGIYMLNIVQRTTSKSKTFKIIKQ